MTDAEMIRHRSNDPLSLRERIDTNAAVIFIAEQAGLRKAEAAG